MAKNEKDKQDDLIGKTMYSVIMSAVMVTLGLIYKLVSRLLVNFENHATEDSWENSFVTKIFAFNFINSYLTLFYYAFYEHDFNELTI